MSHRDTCPSRWEAERQGERDYEWGRSRSSNPHEDRYHSEEGCPVAAEAWRSGYRHAEIREEEHREEAAAQRRAEMQRAERQAEEDYAYEMSAREYHEFQEEQQESAEALDAVDPVDRIVEGQPPREKESS